MIKRTWRARLKRWCVRAFFGKVFLVEALKIIKSNREWRDQKAEFDRQLAGLRESIRVLLYRRWKAERKRQP